MKIFIAVYLLDFIHTGWGTTSFCLISNFSCEKHSYNFLDLSAVFFFSWSEPEKSDLWFRFSMAPARVRYWIPLNAVCREFSFFKLTKVVTHNNNEENVNLACTTGTLMQSIGIRNFFWPGSGWKAKCCIQHPLWGWIQFFF